MDCRGSLHEALPPIPPLLALKRRYLLETIGDGAAKEVVEDVFIGVGTVVEVVGMDNDDDDAFASVVAPGGACVTGTAESLITCNRLEAGVACG